MLVGDRRSNVNLIVYDLFGEVMKMKTLTKLISLVMAVCILGCYSLSVSASAYDQKHSELWVNAGGSTFTTVSSTTNKTRTTCYMRLAYFKFTYYPENSMPGGKYIYSRLYTLAEVKASNVATFSGVTAVGNYNYSYLSGYGTNGHSYKLKCNSSYSLTGYWATFDWSANPYE